MQTQIEAYLQKTILPELEKGRPGWDKPHTLTVVHYIKQIIETNPSLHLDSDVLIIAAYAHDWGYAGLFDAGRLATYAENLDKKEAHMRLGAEKIEQLLLDPPFNSLSESQKKRVIHLVAVHDAVETLHDPDELVLMEADTLGMTDHMAVKPTHTKTEYIAWRKATEEKRISRFITDYSKRKIAELLDLREHYYSTLISA